MSEPTEAEMCATFAGYLHAMPFSLDEWVEKIDRYYLRMAGLSMLKTGLPDHPAYIAVHKAFFGHIKTRIDDYQSPPKGFALLARLVRAPKSARDLGEAFEIMKLVDEVFVQQLRFILVADVDGHKARLTATRL